MKIPLLWTAPIIRIVYTLWCRTLRYVHTDRHNLNDPVDQKKPVCVAIWHNEIFPLLHVRGKQRLAAIVSQSRDGEFVARLFESMDVKTARGSSSRGGVKALIKATRLMRKEGRAMCITVDGPRGPRHEVKEGIVHLAKIADAQIVPLRVVMNNCITFNSWDRFQLPLPFSRVEMIFGTPFKLDEFAAEEDEVRILLGKQKVKALLEKTAPQIIN